MEYNLKRLVSTMFEHRKNRNFEKNGMRTSYQGLSVKASIGMSGNLTKIPWISFLAEGQTNTKGIYPVLLFYGTPEFIESNKNETVVKKIVLAYGISATETPDKSWGEAVRERKTIKEAFNEWNYETKDIIVKRYSASYVFNVYDWTDKLNYKQIQEDIDKLIEIYKNVIASASTVTIYPTEPIVESTVRESEEDSGKSETSIMVKLSDLAKSANAVLPETLLAAIKEINPKSFEVLIKRLLVAMGYGKTEEDVKVTQYVGDGGIDGYVRKDRLDIEKLCAYQAKRYTNTKVSIGEMNALGGSMINYGTTCGIFVTTSDFTPSARSYNPRGYTIILINGKDLVKYLIEYGIGVKEEKIIVKTVDNEFLKSL